MVYGDEKKLKQILLNLLSNSAKFTDKGSIALNIERKDEKIRFTVEDTGIGIPESKLKEIFLPFKQLSDLLNKSDGTGLGLSISYNFVKIMGGELEVESIHGKGSKFSFQIELRKTSHEMPVSLIKEDTVIPGPEEKKTLLLPPENILSSSLPMAFCVIRWIGSAKVWYFA